MDRREFLKTTSSTILLALAQKSYALEDQFKINSTPEGIIYWGTNNQATYENPAFVDRMRVVSSTPEYREIKSKENRLNESKKQILTSKASDKSIKWITKYSEREGHDLVLELRYFEQTGKDPFSQLPSKFDKFSLDDLLSELDITEKIIDANKS
ncbi:MAG: hypothetical protein U9Q06_03680 [Nanoarchaeota archaeon]|nr:hypothetical protein [Nanoarchaeota archaeon]